MRPLATVLAIAASVSASGCCDLALYLCGPDQSLWVSEGFDTPAAAVATFREAVRRADAQAVHRSLSEDFKARTGLIGSIEAELAWRRIQEEVPGAHVLGHAEVGEFVVHSPARVSVELAVAGRRLRVGLVRQPYWEIRWIYDGDPNQIERAERYVPSLERLGALKVDEAEWTTRATLALPPLDVEIPDIDLVQRIGAGVEWKVDSIDEVDS